MIKVMAVEIEGRENPGCTNGNYPMVTLTLLDGTDVVPIHGLTCRCGNGCSNTWRTRDLEGMAFHSMSELWKELES